MDQLTKIKQDILELVEQREYIKPEELLESLAQYDPRQLSMALSALQEEFQVCINKKGKITLPKHMGYYVGNIEVKQAGFGFLRTDDIGDLFIAKKDLNGALNGQKVVVRKRKTFHGDNPEGAVEKILDDKAMQVVGLFTQQKGSAFVICDDKGIPDIFISKVDNKGAKNGQKVVVEITKRARGKRAPEGKVIEILGYKEDKGVDFLSVVKAFDLPYEFPSPVLSAAKRLNHEPGQEELEGRELLFDKKVFTIDGDDAKDLDDAVSIEYNKKGNYILGVHIADVSHYVKPGGSMDKEAYKRGTSVYLIDHVVPMLPKELSNGICSLHEKVTRLTLSCFMEIDKKGKVVSHRIAKTAIRSCHRMTYANVNKILAGDGKVIGEYQDIWEPLRIMGALAKVLRERRKSQGSIDFDIDEAKIKLNEKGMPISIRPNVRGEGEKLIEEFMLLANRTVAEDFFFSELPFVYRVHEVPDKDKMKELGIFLSNFGYRVKGTNDIHAKTLQQILDRAQGTPEENIVGKVVLRSMKKAKYSMDNVGHFGLSFPIYTHFTSPIRRYPDLMVHRLVKKNLMGQLSMKEISRLENTLPEDCKHASDREIVAQKAEREIDDIKKAKYMQHQLGREFDAVISGVTKNVLFAELENTVEGVIPLSGLKGDYYEYYEKLYCVIGRRTKRKISLGDKVRICVRDVNVDTHRIEFQLIEHFEG